MIRFAVPVDMIRTLYFKDNRNFLGRAVASLHVDMIDVRKCFIAVTFFCKRDQTMDLLRS